MFSNPIGDSIDAAHRACSVFEIPPQNKELVPNVENVILARYE
jgi:hypothetical protein